MAGCVRKGRERRFSRRAGSALVLVLAILVLLLGITLAFFSQTAAQRQISGNSADSARAGFLADAALKVILDDISHEIEAGSLPDPKKGLAVPLHMPRAVTNAANMTFAPSMVLQRVGDEGITNIVKVSRRDLPFFATRVGYDEPEDGRPKTGYVRASSISTDQPSVNQRKISLARWNRAALMTDGEFAKFSAPDWIYVDRTGRNPRTFSPADLKQYSLRAGENGSYVLGRFSYVMYDVGGLLDINVAGNALTAAENARKGRLHQVFVDKVAGIELPSFASLVGWRSPVSSTRGGFASGDLFDPARDFISVPGGDQTFLNRQDLINYTKKTGSPLPKEALPFLTTYSRALDRPGYFPWEKAGQTEPDANDFNPGLSTVRFASDTILHRPEGDVKVKAGSPVMPRRFPLGKLSLLEQTDPDAAEVRYYFGLEKNADGNWDYVEGNRIAKLQEVAAAGREPNFFEVLQAVISHGSLGRNAGDTLTFDDARDSLQNLQVMQIGANIIDQWDGDDKPTEVRFPSGVSGEWIELYGVENLPYINNISLVGHHPEYNREKFQLWGVFDLWNPHQNAKTAPKDITALRIHPRGGRCHVRFQFVPLDPSPPNLNGPKQSISDLNSGQEFRIDPFNGGAGFAEPVVMGGAAPLTSEARPGVLFYDYNLPPAIDETPARSRPGYGVKAYNLFRVIPDPGNEIVLELQALIDGKWRTYQTVDGILPTARAGQGTPTALQLLDVDPAKNTHHSKPDADLANCFYSWRQPGSMVNFVKFDPRTERFGHSAGTQSTLGTTIRMSSAPYTGSAVETQSNWRVLQGTVIAGVPLDGTDFGFERMTFSGGATRMVPFGLIANAPEGAVGNTQPSRYKDRDGNVRPGDGYLGALPTVPGRLSDRSLILNRPFRSVGELGYVFRDIPWKTVDFFSKQSGDLGLLDAFSLDAIDGAAPLVAGKVNLNTRRPEVLAVALKGTANGLGGLTGIADPGSLGDTAAKELSERIVQVAKTEPFLSAGDAVSRALAPSSGTTPNLTANWGPTTKTAREAPVRTLSGLTTTRTWNFMIDLIVQTGLFPEHARSGADFVVRGESRYWIHLAIDRMTGEVLDRKVERVDE